MILFTQLQAQVRVGVTEAYLTAEKFVSQQGNGIKQKLNLCEEIKSTEMGLTNLFVFSMEPKGYVIVSALNDVLAYSLNSTLPTSAELPDNIYWIELYNKQTNYLLLHPDQVKKPTKHEHSVGPLLTSVWGQGYYYNEACPEDMAGDSWVKVFDLKTIDKYYAPRPMKNRSIQATLWRFKKEYLISAIEY